MKKFLLSLTALIFIFAIAGRFIPGNITTPFFRKNISYTLYAIIEVVSLVGASGVCYFVINQRKRKVYSGNSFIIHDDVKVQKQRFMLIYLLLNVIIVLLFINPPGWDFGSIVYDLEKLIKFSDMNLRIYLMKYPNNLLYAMFLYPLVYLFGADATVVIVVVLNILLLLITFNYFYELVYKVTGSIVRTRVGAVLFICSLPLLYYNQTFYSDTIVLPFIFSALYFLFEKDGQLTTNKRHFVKANALLLMAMLVKPTVIIIIIAVSMLAFVSFKGWNKIYSLSIVFCYTAMKIVAICLVFLWSSFYPPLYNKAVSDIGYPESAWICMAQNDMSRGDYNFDDTAWIDSIYNRPNVGKQDVDKIMKQCIHDRLTSRSISENIFFHFKKFAFSWSDPTYYSVYNLGLISSDGDSYNSAKDAWDITGVKSVTKLNLYLEDGPIAVIHYLVLDIFQISLYMLVIIIVIRQLLFKLKANALSYLLILIFIGTALFHLIWEARSRYILAVAILILLFIVADNTLFETDVKKS